MYLTTDLYTFILEINEDDEFRVIFSKLLVDHAWYISTFPEVYEKNHTTNHTVADYLGLLYISSAIPDHPQSKY